MISIETNFFVGAVAPIVSPNLSLPRKKKKSRHCPHARQNHISFAPLHLIYKLGSLHSRLFLFHTLIPTGMEVPTCYADGGGVLQ